MKAFQEPLEPVALRGQVVELRPSGTLRRVEDVEPIPHLGPFDMSDGGGIAAGNSLTNEEITELNMPTGTLGQFRVHAISPVEVEVSQTGQSQTRYENAQQRGYVAPGTPSHVTTVFVFEDETVYFNIRNDNTYALQRARLAFTGYKFLLESGDLSRERVEGQPIAVPISKLEAATQGGANASAPTQGAAPRGD